MLGLPLHWILQENMVLSKRDYEECHEHVDLSERIRKTLYYGITPGTDRPSLPVTEIAVEFLQDAAPQTLGQVDNYLVSSIGKKASLSPCSLMLGMLYIERLKHRNPDYLQQVSSSDLFLIAMMVASKYLYDEGIEEEVFNEEWAESAKIDVEELNDLERTFLAAIDWNLFVKPEDFWKILGAMEQRIALDKGLERGFFTYTDLDVVSQDGRMFETVKQVAEDFGKVVLVFSVAYFAGAVTMVGAPMALSYLKTGLPLSGSLLTWSLSHLSLSLPVSLLSSDIQPHFGSQSHGELLPQPLSVILPDPGQIPGHVLLSKPKTWPDNRKEPNPEMKHYRILDHVMIDWLLPTDIFSVWNSMAVHTLNPAVLKDSVLCLGSSAGDRIAPFLGQFGFCCHFELKDMDVICSCILCSEKHRQNLTSSEPPQLNCIKTNPLGTGHEGTSDLTTVTTLQGSRPRNTAHSHLKFDCCSCCFDLEFKSLINQAQSWQGDAFAILIKKLDISDKLGTAMAG